MLLKISASCCCAVVPSAWKTQQYNLILKHNITFMFSAKTSTVLQASRHQDHIRVGSGGCGNFRLMQDVDFGSDAAVDVKKKLQKQNKNGVMTNWSEHVWTKPWAVRRHVSLPLFLFTFEYKTSIVLTVSELCRFGLWNSGVVTRIWKISPQPESTQCWVENGFWVNYCFEMQVSIEMRKKEKSTAQHKLVSAAVAHSKPNLFFFSLTLSKLFFILMWAIKRLE